MNAISPQSSLLANSWKVMIDPAGPDFVLLHKKRVPKQIEGKMTTLSDLTPRELQILHLILAGQTNKQIAAEIYISEKTVEFHLKNIYTKVGVRTRNLVSVWAVRQGADVEINQIHGKIGRSH
jgi:DNA-binding CsgD family transcriptional regulator